MQRADAQLRHEAFLEPTAVNMGIITNHASAAGGKTSRLLPRLRAFLSHVEHPQCLGFVVVRPGLWITSPRDLSDSNSDARINKRLQDDFMPLLRERF